MLTTGFPTARVSALTCLRAGLRAGVADRSPCRCRVPRRRGSRISRWARVTRPPTLCRPVPQRRVHGRSLRAWTHTAHAGAHA